MALRCSLFKNATLEVAESLNEPNPAKKGNTYEKNLIKGAEFENTEYYSLLAVFILFLFISSFFCCLVLSMCLSFLFVLFHFSYCFFERMRKGKCRKSEPRNTRAKAKQTQKCVKNTKGKYRKMSKMKAVLWHCSALSLNMHCLRWRRILREPNPAK